MNFTKIIATTIFSLVMIAGVAGCASTSKQESTGEYVDDSVITTKVKAAFFNDPVVKVFDVNVETFKGVVQLSGFVDSQATALKAVSVAKTVPGVRSVTDAMRVK